MFIETSWNWYSFIDNYLCSYIHTLRNRDNDASVVVTLFVFDVILVTFIATSNIVLNMVKLLANKNYRIDGSKLEYGYISYNTYV